MEREEERERERAQKTEVENGSGGAEEEVGGGSVFFSYVSLKQIHKHVKLCISIIIICK